jgi:DNA-binding MarR family transcriptional regulator
LEERGWVLREDCLTDRRGQIARLTDEGFAVLAAAAPGHVAAVRRLMVDVLTPAQLETIAAAGEAIVAAAANER